MPHYGKNCIGSSKASEGNLHEFEIERKTAIVEFSLFELEIRWEKPVGNTARAVFDPTSNVTSTSKSPDEGFEPTTNGLTV
jgi:hypothetical protein